MRQFARATTSMSALPLSKFASSDGEISAVMSPTKPTRALVAASVPKAPARSANVPIKLDWREENDSVSNPTSNVFANKSAIFNEPKFGVLKLFSQFKICSIIALMSSIKATKIASVIAISIEMLMLAMISIVGKKFGSLIVGISHFLIISLNSILRAEQTSSGMALTMALLAAGSSQIASRNSLPLSPRALIITSKLTVDKSLTVVIGRPIANWILPKRKFLSSISSRLKQPIILFRTTISNSGILTSLMIRLPEKNSKKSSHVALMSQALLIRHALSGIFRQSIATWRIRHIFILWKNSSKTSSRSLRLSKTFFMFGVENETSPTKSVLVETKLLSEEEYWSTNLNEFKTESSCCFCSSVLYGRLLDVSIKFAKSFGLTDLPWLAFCKAKSNKSLSKDIPACPPSCWKSLKKSVIGNCGRPKPWSLPISDNNLIVLSLETDLDLMKEL